MPAGICGTVADATGIRLEVAQPRKTSDEQPSAAGTDRSVGWWSAEPNFRGMADGMASWLDRHWGPIEAGGEAASVMTNEKSTRNPQAVCHLWISDAQAKIREAFGGCLSVRQAALLLFGLCWPESECDAACLLMARQEDARSELRVLRACRAVAGASHRPGLYQQLAREYPDTLQELPRFLAHTRQEDREADRWAHASHRVAHGVAHRPHRIKCLGNGQVPLCAAAAWRILGGP